MEFKNIGISDSSTNFAIRSTSGVDQIKQSCLVDVVTAAFSNWTSAKKTYAFAFTPSAFQSTGSFSEYDSTANHKYSDGRVVWKIWDEILRRSDLPRLDTLPNGQQGTPYSETRNQFINCTTWAQQAGICDTTCATWQFGGGGTSSTPACFDGSILVDKDCKLIDKSAIPAGGQCGTLRTTYNASTPVSLIFDAAADPMSHYTIVSFPLELASSTKYWEWRGSAAAPIVVYDPEHTGRITSAQQVFGNWTFGGQREASLVAGRAKPWRDGFEALAELDTDRDEQISGAELAPLGLWFDANRDAVSQPGEVRALHELAIQALFYKVDVRDAASGDVTVKVGYKRVVDGKVVTGKAVDWMAKGHSDASSLVLGRLLSDRSASAKEGHVAPAPRVSNEFGEQSELSSLQAQAATIGIWAVTIEPANVEELQGIVGDTFLAFDGGVGGELSGYALSTLGIRGAGNAQESISFSRVAGDVRFNDDGTAGLAFSSQSQGTTLASKAIVALDGSTMRGTTTGTLASKKTFTYSWQAARIAVPK